MRKLLIGVVAVLSLLTAAGAAVSSSDESSTERFVPGALFSCGGQPFSLAPFDGPAGAEDEDHPSAAGLREILRNPDWDPEIPAENGWRLLYRDDDIAAYAAGRPVARGIPFVSLEPAKAQLAPWRFSGSSSNCRLAAYSEDLNNATWRPRRDSEPSPTDTSIKSKVIEQSCASGKSPKGRIVEPTISYGENKIVVTVFIERLPGDFQTCQGNPAGKYTFRLTEPIGKRNVVDGGRYPFRPRVALP